MAQLICDVASFGSGPVWVYVLEKEDAVRHLLALTGPENPTVAREQSPSSLRARYGQSLEDNVLYVASDEEMAQIQIDSIFVFSPPFPPANLSNDDLFENEEELERSVLTDTGLHNRERSFSYDSPRSYSNSGNENVKAVFRARPVPSTTALPSIQPRMSRASALRAGLDVGKSGPNKARGPPTKEELARTFANVPGHKRSST
jgi:hypothetical protein